MLSTELSGIDGRVREAEAAVASEQARLDGLEASLAAEQARLASLETTIAEQTARLAVLQRQYDSALGVLERHLRAIYETESPDVISIVLGAHSFAELLDSYDLLSKIGRQDERIASRLDQAHTSLEQTRAKTEQAKQDAARSTALDRRPGRGAASGARPDRREPRRARRSPAGQVPGARTR